MESAVNQTYQNLGIIVINNGTKDRSAVIAKEYANKDICIRVYDYINGGLSAARNRGLKLSIGKSVAFLDSYDCLIFNMYEEIIKNILNLRVDFINY